MHRYISAIDRGFHRGAVFRISNLKFTSGPSVKEYAEALRAELTKRGLQHAPIEWDRDHDESPAYRTRAEGQGKMNQKSQLEAGFKVGDRVRLVAETLSWRAEKTLQGQIAEVIELRENGRVSVRFDNGRLLMGRDTGSFERVAGLEVKAKK